MFASPTSTEAGEEVAVRFRCALDGSDRFKWKRGTKPCLYGLSRLDDAKAKGFVVLVEGESDCHTLWYHGIPALGLPGAVSWRDEWAKHFNGISTIYVVIEPDQGGSALRNTLAAASLRDRVRLVHLDGVKDPSALHIVDPDQFKVRFQAALDAARPLLDAAAEEQRNAAAAAWASCATLAQSPRILSRAVRVARELGVVGERRPVQLLVLAFTSRLLDRPVSVAVNGLSSSGKSFLVEQVSRLFPSSAAYTLSAMSERALAYSEEPSGRRGGSDGAAGGARNGRGDTGPRNRGHYRAPGRCTPPARQSAAWRRVQRALKDGYLRNREDRRGRPARLEVGDPLPADVPILPLARDLRRGGGGHACPSKNPQPLNRRPTQVARLRMHARR
jgi:hypothetical protein